ncbi:MAG: isochorismatase family protein [Chloroflexota bacterium]
MTRERSFHARLFGDPPPPDLRRDNTALLVVDMQYFDAHPDWGEGLTAKQMGVEGYFDEYFQRIDEITPRIQRLLAASRAAGIEVIHLRVSELTEDSRDVGRKQAVRGLFVPRSSKEADLLEGLTAEGDEIVISKSSSGVFAWTNLDRLLQTMRIDNLIYTGTATSGCIESAVKDAADLGYRALIVDDACASSTMADHSAALVRMDGGPNQIVQTEEMLDAIERLSAQPVPARRQALARHLATPAAAPQGGGPDDPYRAIFLSPPPPDLSIASTALVLLDCQRLTASADGSLVRLAEERGLSAELAAYFERVSTTLPQARALLVACRGVGVPVIHARLADQTEAGRDVGPRHRAYGLRVAPSSADAQFLPGLDPRGDEIVLNRSGAGLFATTNVDRLLRNMAVTTVIIAGTSFDGGIEATIRSAADRDYDVVLASDAASLFWASGDLKKMQAGLTTVMAVDDLIAALTAQARPAVD